MFTINRWPDDSNVDHFATTWILAEKLSKDKNKNLIIDNKIVTITDNNKIKIGNTILTEDNMANFGIKAYVIKSKKYLNAWDTGFDVPVSAIWYVAALRHLKDEDGDEIDNDRWVGPTPTISEKSFKNEFFASKLYIQPPYIKEFNYTPGDKLELVLPKPKSNVFYLGTILEIRDENKKVILTKIYNIEKTNNVITITNDDVELDNYNILHFKLMHVGNHSTLSSPYEETFMLKKVFFNINGRRKDLEPLDVNEIVLVKTSPTSVTIEKAELLSGDKKEVITPCEVVDKEIVRIPNNVMNFNSSYVVRLKLKIVYQNDKEEVIDYYVPITTRSFKQEKTNIIEDYFYKNTLEEVRKYVYEDSVYRLSKDKLFNTEEFFTYLIPLPNKKEKDTSLFIFGRDEHSFSAFKTGFLKDYENITIRLLTKDIGYIQTTNNGKLELKSFDYNSYNDACVIKHNLTFNLVNKFNYLRKVTELNNAYYVAGVSANDNKTIEVYKYNPISNTTVKVASRTIDFKIEDISFVEQGYSNGLIYCKGKDVIRFYLYVSTTNDIVDSLPIPSAFKNSELYLEQLLNGDIIGIKYNNDNKPLDYFIIDVKENKIKIYENNSYKGNGKFIHFAKLKNGDIVATLLEEGNKKNTIRLYKYH